MFYSFFFSHFLVFVFGLIHLHYILPTDLSFYVFAFLSNSAGSLFLAKIFFPFMSLFPVICFISPPTVLFEK